MPENTLYKFVKTAERVSPSRPESAPTPTPSPSLAFGADLVRRTSQASKVDAPSIPQVPIVPVAN